MNSVKKEQSTKVVAKKSAKEISAKREENKVKNRSKKSKSGVIIHKKVAYLREGVTGKQVQLAQRESNNTHKEDMGKFNTMLKRAKQFDKGYITSFKLTRKMLTENKLKEFMTETEIVRQVNNVAKLGFERYTVWGIQQLIRRMAKVNNSEA